MIWRPLLHGADAARARQLARSIGDGLLAEPPPRFLGLGDGLAGMATCLAYLAEELPELASGRDAAIDAVIDGIAVTAMDASLFAGFVGVAWFVEHFGAGDPAAIDETLPRALDAMSDPGVIGGLAGIGVYCFERLPDEAARVSLNRVIARLASTAVAQPDSSLAWQMPPSLQPTGEDHSDRRFALGVAHGTAGVIGMLAKAAALGIGHELLDAAVRWLLAQKIDGGFAAWRSGPRCKHLAWCNGALGIAGVLLNAAQTTGSKAWLSEAVAIARAATRDHEIVDGGLCHGAAGVAHIFNRFWQATSEPEFGRATTYWIERAIAMVDPASTTLLTGSAGIALALIAATSEREPAWDRLFLLS